MIEGVGHENVATSPANPKLAELCVVPDSSTMNEANSSVVTFEKVGNGRPKLIKHQPIGEDTTKTVYSTNINKIEFKAPGDSDNI